MASRCARALEAIELVRESDMSWASIGPVVKASERLPVSAKARVLPDHLDPGSTRELVDAGRASR